MTNDLWNDYQKWQESCRWVDLSRDVGEKTPHWGGFPAFEAKKLYTHTPHGFEVDLFTTVGQYGTHADAPFHFIPDGATLDAFTPADMVMRLCIIDKSETVCINPDYSLTSADIIKWEVAHGRIPDGAFVAFRTDWSKRGTQEEMENKDAEGRCHYPGWSVEAIEFLVHERNVGAIGHETFDTDTAVVSAVCGYQAEIAILKSGRFQIELLKNLDQCPPTGGIIFCTFPKITGANGFPARCFALCSQ